MSKSKKKSKEVSKITKAKNRLYQKDEPKEIVENLYQKNIELLVKNKTLSLLSKLYEISILTLKPKELAMRISQTVQIDLSFELVGVMIFDAKSDSLIPLAFSNAERVDRTLNQLSLPLEEINISTISKRELLKQAVYSKKYKITTNLKDIWGDLIDSAKFNIITLETHIKTLLVYPLIVENKILGVIILALNRDFEVLNSFEKDSIKSFVNLIALSLEKSFLYQELENANSKLRELDRQKDSVLHMVAHQLKGPVTSINFITELLLDGTYGQLSSEQKENIATIRAASQKMGSQSEMVLDAAKITSGKLPLVLGPLNLNALFDEIVGEAQNHAKEKKIQLKVSLPTLAMPTVILDKRYTQLAIDNLLSNAIKYTALKSQDSIVEFTVEIKDNTLYCKVKDNGIGIPKADQEHIFKELYRASNAGTDGNGLGLHVAVGAIQAQGGKIHFESEENKGTTFYVELPLKLAPAEEKSEEKKSMKKKK